MVTFSGNFLAYTSSCCCCGRHRIIIKNHTCRAPNVYFEGDNAINLEAELARSRRIKCCCCGLKGAALGCYEKSCRKSFHVPCAKLTHQCRWDTVSVINSMLCSSNIILIFSQISCNRKTLSSYALFMLLVSCLMKANNLKRGEKTAFQKGILNSVDKFIS